MRRKEGFTLVEMIVVVIIISILATLATGRYQRIAEKGRASEAKKILGMIRQAQASYYLEVLSYSGTNLAGLGYGQLPGSSACDAEYYFWYNITAGTATNFTATAARCTSGGKSPQWGEVYVVNVTKEGIFGGNGTGII